MVGCGHPPPLLLRGALAAFIEPYAAPPLGLLDLTDGWRRASMLPVGDGDQLLLYTDGVSEARDEAGRFFPLAQVTADAVAAPDLTALPCSTSWSPAWTSTSATAAATTSSCCW